jgi:hypothetical protein
MRKLWIVLLLLLFALPVEANINNRVFDKDCGDGLTDENLEDEFDRLYDSLYPEYIEDASSNAAAHQATKDPTGALPTNLLHEIQELRYKLDQLQPNNTYWYDDYDSYEYGYANLVPNGGFEYWDDGIASAPDGWELVGGTTVSQTITTNTGYAGDSWAIEVTSAGLTSNGIKYTFDNLKASTTYAVVVKAKVTAGDTAKASTTGGSSNLSQTTVTQTWVYSLNGTFTTDATPAPVILTLGSDTSGDIVYFDNLMVVEGAMTHAYAPNVPSVPLTHPTYRKLVVESTSITTITITADYVVVENPTTKHRIALQNVSETTDITSLGIGGIDVGSEADITYYQYVIYKPVTATVDCLMSSSATNPTLPSGYTYYKLVGFCRNDTDIVLFKQRDEELLYDAPFDLSILAAATATVWTDVDATEYTGTATVSGRAILSFILSDTSDIAAGEEIYVDIRINGSSGNGKRLAWIKCSAGGGAPCDYYDTGEFMVFMDSAQKIEYKATVGSATGDFNLYVVGCILDL